MKQVFLSLLLAMGLILLLSSLLLSGPSDADSFVNPMITPTAFSYLPLVARNWLPCERRPYPGPAPHPIPGKIEAENYDIGCEGVAYHDTTPGNTGGACRNDDVDIEACLDTDGGCNVSRIEKGEWLEYTVDVASDGQYDIQVRVASAAITGTLHIEFDGADVTGPMIFWSTCDWQKWNSVFAHRVSLTAGQHVMRVSMDSSNFDVNWIWFRKSVPDDVSGEEKINQLLDQMTLEEKIAQLHGICWMDTAANTRLWIPGFGMADGPHGVRDGKATSFPVGIAMAATWDPVLLERVGVALGEEFRGKGRNQALGPCIDINRDPRNGRGPESAGEEPYLAGKIGVALVRGIQSTQAIATVKHFAAKNHQSNRNYADHRIDARTSREFYGMPFRMAVQQGGARSVMSSYNWINGRPNSANYELLTKILRDEWGYRYYVVSDWGSIYTTATLAINAGCDLEMPHDPGKYPGELPDAIRNGAVTTATLNEAVRRVLRTKFAAGLLGDYPPGDPGDVCSQEHRALALEVAQKSIVLLKNGDHILPLTRTMPITIALIGPSADVARLDGTGSSVVEPCHAITPKQGLENRAVPTVTILYARGCDINSEDTSSFPAAIDAARKADYVVFVGGLDNTQEGEGRDRMCGSVQLPGQQQALINALAAVNPNVIVVLESGGIVALEQCFDSIKGLIYAFYPGQEGGNAIADVLFGNVNPGGKLPVTMPISDTQLPDWNDLDFTNDVVDGFGYRRFDSLGLTPQYAFGYGLSYTTFGYGNLAVTPTVASGDTPIHVSVDMTNTGSISGDEVVQLYLSVDFDPVADAVVPMPVKQLRGFERVTLAPEQTKTVTFTLGPEEFSFWSVSDDSFRVEAGTYTIQVGGSSDNLPLSRTFRLTSSVLYDSAIPTTSTVLLPVLGNVALNRPAFSCCAESPGLLASNAVDGDLTTRWSSGFSDPQWIYVDLGVRKDIERMILHWETAYAKAYQIQVSDDAIHWTDIYSTTNGNGEVDNLKVRRAGRYVRMYGTQRGTEWGYSLWELEVYGIERTP